MTETTTEQPRVFGAGAVGLDDEVILAPEALSDPTKMDNPLEALRDTIVSAVERPDLVLAVLTRPGLTIRYATSVDMEHLQRWRKSAEDKSAPDKFNLLKFSLLVLANTCKAMALRGQEPVGSDGKPLTFISRELSEWTGERRHLDIVRTLYSSDGHVVQTAQEILDAAGYADDQMEPDEDPTQGS